MLNDKLPFQVHEGADMRRLEAHGFRSFGLSMRLTSANLRVFLAFPILAAAPWPA